MITSIHQLTAAICLLLIASAANSVVIRHDVSESKYHATESDIPALVDIPMEGHGVLVAPRWVVTAAHVVTWQSTPVKEVSVGGKSRLVKRIIIHPGYKAMPHVPSSGDIAPFTEFLASRDDIALIELEDTVSDVAPLPMYRKTDELGRVVTFFGKGATGDGAKGVNPHAPHRTRLRKGVNQISAADGKWLEFVFDSGPNGNALEAYTGGGDSGGPLLVEEQGQRWLTGLASYTRCTGDIAACRPGLYGSIARQVRISAYVPWIERTMNGESGQTK